MVVEDWMRMEIMDPLGQGPRFGDELEKSGLGAGLFDGFGRALSDLQHGPARFLGFLVGGQGDKVAAFPE